MKMHVLSGGRLSMRRNVYFPGAEPEERIEIPVSCVLLRHSQANVLFDTGCHPDAAIRGAERWGALARVMTPVFSPEETVVSQLAKADLVPADIDVVFCSHLHADHCGCNSFFPAATLICHAEELKLARSDGAVAAGYFRQEWDSGGRIETLDGQRDLFGDGTVTLIPAPGHTPGTTIAHLVLDRDGDFLLVSDAVPMQAHLASGYAPRNTWNVDLAVKSIDEIARFEKNGTTIVYGHDAAQWEAMRKGGEYYT